VKNACVCSPDTIKSRGHSNGRRHPRHRGRKGSFSEFREKPANCGLKVRGGEVPFKRVGRAVKIKGLKYEGTN